ncbi:MAG: SDR family NAD(P)-dependent oxidoreductase [Hyphomicrobiaceae bacterium]
MNLTNKVAVVTGGSGGLGRRICKALAAAGCNVAIVYARSEDAAKSVAHDLREVDRVRATAFQCDVTDPRSVDALSDSVVAEFGHLDILINDAAYNQAIAYKNIDALTHDVWSKILDVNLTGPMLMCKSVAPIMARQGVGRIVNIASIAGLYPGGSSIAYAVSKAGLIHLTKCMAVALAPHTLVNCVAPGLLEGTRATENLPLEMIQASANAALLKMPADKDDCADQVVTFCQSDTTTGQTIVIDSGRYFH